MPIQLEHMKVEPDAYRTLMGVARYVNNAEVSKTLRHLIDMRASQINGCSFCLDMHIHEAKQAGETDQRIFLLPVWHETSLFSPEERAVLALTEHVTRISEGGVPDGIDRELRNHFSERQIVQLLMMIIHINAWNRLGVSTGMQPAAR